MLSVTYGNIVDEFSSPYLDTRAGACFQPTYKRNLPSFFRRNVESHPPSFQLVQAKFGTN